MLRLMNDGSGDLESLGLPERFLLFLHLTIIQKKRECKVSFDNILNKKTQVP